jgi:cell division inhibitor SulA/protein ImuA
MKLEEVLQRADVWRGSFAPPQATVPSGWPRLDAALGGGWPLGALSEILLSRAGAGELSLLLPALARRRNWLVFITPPYLPQAMALARAGVDPGRVLLVQPQGAGEALWAASQALRSGACGAVLLWAERLDDKDLRRLQLAAEHGGGLGFLFRGIAHAREGSPAGLRLRLQAVEGCPRCLEVCLLKRRGGSPFGPMRMELNDALGRAIPAAACA